MEQVANLPQHSLLKCICDDGHIIIMRAEETNHFSTLLYRARQDSWTRWIGTPIDIRELDRTIDTSVAYYIANDYKSKLEIQDAFTQYWDGERIFDDGRLVVNDSTSPTYDVEFNNGATASWAIAPPSEPLRGTPSLSPTSDVARYPWEESRAESVGPSSPSVDEHLREHVSAINNLIQREGVSIDNADEVVRLYDDAVESIRLRDTQGSEDG
jgi:hypothetical protein